MNRSWLKGAIAILVAIAAVPYFLNLAGDAQVHLAIAEAFSRGMNFQYNPGGDIVVASTSPFWTIMLVGFYEVAGSAAPLLLAIAGVVIWLAAGWLLYRAAHEFWKMPAVALWAVVLLWLLHTTIVANALGGLENVLSALQLLLLYVLTATWRDGLTPGRSVLLGAVLGWTILTRPDGGLLALLLLAVYALVILLAPGRRRSAVANLALVGLVALVVLVPWYAYQYAHTGRLVTDSSIARLYTGRHGSLPLIPGTLYMHPKAILSLGSAFLPLAFGALVTTLALGRSFFRRRGSFLQWLTGYYPQVTAVLLVAAGIVFYTFVVGAEAFGRYFLPLFPFLFLAGVGGWVRVYDWLADTGRPRTAVVVVGLVALFMVASSLGDAARRLGPGRFETERVLDVIYGPAHRRYYSANLDDLLRAPDERTASTNALLGDLAVNGQPISLAVTEVQLRYFVDERVEIVSLDGRTAADILDYTDPLTGVPDFERYFEVVRPDYVHANQWCAVGGWLAGVFISEIEENLVCRWEQQAAEMEVGDSFDWNGRMVTLAAPEILHIEWDGSCGTNSNEPTRRARATIRSCW